jgi:PITH domain
MDDPCHGHSHDHDHDDARGVSLRRYYDIEGVRCGNESIAGSGRQMMAKYYEDRFVDHPMVKSPDDDPELLLTIPFTEAVTVQYLTVRGRHPRHIKLFVNRNDLDFESARDMPGDMALEWVPGDHMHVEDNGQNGTVDYPLRPAGRFRNIDVLTIFFLDHYDDDDDETPNEIYYVGLKGVGSGIKRQCVEAVYESQGMLKDHKVPDDVRGSSMLF